MIFPMLTGTGDQIGGNVSSTHSEPPLTSSKYGPQGKSPSEPIRLSLADRNKLEERLLQDPRVKTVPVWLFDSRDEGKAEVELTDQNRWRRFAERELYRTFYYKNLSTSNLVSVHKQWEDHYRMNQKFADKIMSIYRPGDIIWVHDYHLMLLPTLLRQRVSDIFVGFYLHAPFPSSEYVRCLAQRKELLMGMLGSNMIGFQTYDYVEHFVSCCIRILGIQFNDANPEGVVHRGTYIPFVVSPIGIDASKAKKTPFEDSSVKQFVHSIRRRHPESKIIVGRDRLDTTRGVAQKLQAFNMFLKRYPRWRDKVVLVQLTSPTSIEEDKEDDHITDKVARLVIKINNDYGNRNLEYGPVLHYSGYFTKARYFALLRAADVGLITSARDGMNTTSLEYVMCQEKNKGPLILSEFSGTASSLEDAISINPWDFNGVADAINQALTMSSDEKDRRHANLYKHVTTNTVQEWCKTYLNHLRSSLRHVSQSTSTPLLDKRSLHARYKTAKRRLFMFDYDGTLTPIVRDPQAAIPSDRILRTIKTLAEDKRNHVWIISGRDQAFLEEGMGHIPELGLSAEHGSFLRPPNAADGAAWTNLTETMDVGWQAEVLRVFEAYAERTPGSWVERKKIALTWHFRRVDPEHAHYLAAQCKKDLEDFVVKRYDVEVMNGKANLEVRPRFVNKGEIAARLVREFGANGPDLVFCAGDDHTDEDMFRALRASELPPEVVYTVAVSEGPKETLAQWCLLQPPEVIATVAMLNGSVTLEDIEEVGTAWEKLKF